MHRRTASTNNTIDHIDEGELKLGEVSKHSIGIIFIYVQAAFVVFVSLGLAYFLLPSVMEDRSSAFLVANIFGLLAIILAIVVMGLASLVYSQNRLIITDRNITQIQQSGLFSRKVSQLNLMNVEDVTSEQSGVLSTIFGYGVLKIETAGEQVNFHFTYCPKPNYYAKVILNAREKMLGQQTKPVQETLPPTAANYKS